MNEKRVFHLSYFKILFLQNSFSTFFLFQGGWPSFLRQGPYSSPGSRMKEWMKIFIRAHNVTQVLKKKHKKGVPYEFTTQRRRKSMHWRAKLRLRPRFARSLLWPFSRWYQELMTDEHWGPEFDAPTTYFETTYIGRAFGRNRGRAPLIPIAAVE